MHNIGPNVTGHNLETIRKSLKALYVRIPGLRLKKSNKLIKGRTAHFIFDDVYSQHIKGNLDGMGLKVDNRTHFLRAMMKDDKRRHKYCFHCGTRIISFSNAIVAPTSKKVKRRRFQPFWKEE